MVAYVVTYSIILALVVCVFVVLCVFYVRSRKSKLDAERNAIVAKTKGAVVLNAIFDEDDSETSFLVLEEETRTPLYVSPSVVRYFGVTAEDIRLDFDCIKKNIDKKFSRRFDRSYSAWDRNSSLITSFGYGENRFCEMKMIRVEYDEVKYLAMSFRDVTEQKNAHDKMQKKLDAALEQAAAKSTFLSSMSHEIRTPMNGVMGMISLAKMNIADKDKVLNYLERAGDLSVFLLSLINDILDISKIESGKMELFNQQFDIIAFAEKINNMFYSTITGKGINFKVEMVDFTVRHIIGDEMRLTQVVTNLVSNAGKFTPAGGDISVTFKQLDSIGGNAQLMIRVRDTGKGIAPENISKIMRPFEQEEASTAKNYGGTGLGLALCDNMVRMMGGNIVIDSVLGEGSDFSVFVSFPIADVEQNMDTPVELDRPPEELKNYEYNGCRILLAEDNEVNAEIAVDILESEGAKVTLAKDGQEAVDIFEGSPENSFDVLLLDIQMPRLNGREAAKTIRQCKRADAMTVPIIALSADAFVEDIKMSKAAGMDEHISKPVDFDALRVRVGEIIHSKKAQVAKKAKKG